MPVGALSVPCLSSVVGSQRKDGFGLGHLKATPFCGAHVNAHVAVRSSSLWASLADLPFAVHHVILFTKDIANVALVFYNVVNLADIYSKEERADW